MKWSLSSYSLSRYMNEGSLTQLGCVSRAKELGFDTIEFSEIRPHDGSPKAEYAKRLREECSRLSMDVSALVVGADFLLPQSGCMETEIRRVQEMVDISHILGAKYMRHDATRGDGRPFLEVLTPLSDACREVAAYAQRLGITTMVENHGFFCQDSERMELLYKAVDHPSFGLLVDMGNFLCADEVPAKAGARVAPYAVYVHAKDFHVREKDASSPGPGFFLSRGGKLLCGAILGEGVVDVPQCMDLLEEAGYNGFVALEFEGPEDPSFAISAGLAFLKGTPKSAAR